MVSDAILGAVVGGSLALTGTLLQSIFSRQNTKDRIEAEKERRKAEFYIERKSTTLIEFHSELERLGHRIYDYYEKSRQPDYTMEQYYTEVLPLLNSYQEAMGRASIYLDEEQQEVMDEVYQEAVRACQAMQFKINHGDDEIPPDSKTFDGIGLHQAHDEARDVLREVVNKPIEEFE